MKTKTTEYVILREVIKTGMDHPRQRRVVKGFIVACPSRERLLTGGATPSETTCTEQDHTHWSAPLWLSCLTLIVWWNELTIVSAFFVKGFLISGGRRGTIFCKKKVWEA